MKQVRVKIKRFGPDVNGRPLVVPLWVAEEDAVVGKRSQNDGYEWQIIELLGETRENPKTQLPISNAYRA